MVNKVILVGYLGDDPEVRHLENGNQVANFSIATSESYKNKKGERISDTEWHQIVVWNKLSEICEKYLSKGSKVYLEGKIKTESYQSDGQTKYYKKIICNNLTMLDSKQGSSQNSESQNKDWMQEDDGDDLPF